MAKKVEGREFWDGNAGGQLQPVVDASAIAAAPAAEEEDEARVDFKELFRYVSDRRRREDEDCRWNVAVNDWSCG